MSKLKNQINQDLKSAMKTREQHTVTTLRGLMAAIKQVEVDTREELGDEQVSALLQKEIKKLRDALKYAEQENRQELISKNKIELDLVQKYLGAPLSAEELEGLIAELITNGADSIGKVMGALNKDFKGRFDGKIASEFTRSRLG